MADANLHHAMDMKLEKEKIKFCQTSTTYPHDDPMAFSIDEAQVQKDLDRIIHLTENDASNVRKDLDRISDFDDQSRNVERIDWKKKSRQILTSTMKKNITTVKR